MDLNENGEEIIKILEYLLIQNNDTPLLYLFDFMYLGLLENMISLKIFQDDAILCPTIESIEKMNKFILCIYLVKKKLV